MIFSEGDHSLIKILKEEGENLGFTEAGKVNKSHKEGLTVRLTGLEKRVEAFFCFWNMSEQSGPFIWSFPRT